MRVAPRLQWDLDTVFKKRGVKSSIYDQGSKTDNYEVELVGSSSAPFRAEYDAIMSGLLDGPFRQADLFWVIQNIELEIGAAMDADPNNRLDAGGAAAEFDRLRDFISKRTSSILKQLP